MPEQSVSLWKGTTAQLIFPPLKNNISIDVAIVGGGLAGVMAAWYLSNAGIETAIFERSFIGCGTSGNTTAKVTSFHDLKYDYLTKHFGDIRTAIYAGSNQWAISELERIVREEEIACDFRKMPLKAFATTKDGFKKLKKEYKAAEKYNLPISFSKSQNCGPIPAKALINMDDQAIFHPGKFLNALSEKLLEKGVKIYENTGILRFENRDNPILNTKNSEIKAKRVIVATNYPVFDKGFLFLRMNQIRSYAIAARLNTSVPDLMAIGIDTRNLYIRPHFDSIGEWLVISGQDHTTGALPSNGYNPWAELESASRKFFDIKTIDYRWAAQDSMPIDRVPFIGKMPRTKNFYVTTGFGEWGMTPGIISGKIISDLILGIENKWAELYSPSRVKPFSSIKSTISLISHVTKRLGSKIVPFEHFSREKLNPEQGSVFNVQGEKTAVYKDSDGLLKAHSASCTHLKCIVKWNPVEKTWDCPCHGSRFDTDGQVLNSPSISPLKVKDVSNI